MEQAEKFVKRTSEFVSKLESIYSNVTVLNGRKFDRVACDGTVLYFIDRVSWEIFGAKSPHQYNPRRTYGTLDVVSQYTWDGDAPTPIPGTSAERIHNEREAEIQKNYKPRGRPRKNPIVTGV